MAKLTLSDIISGYGATTLYNANNALIEAALENTLSRDGSTPNTMGSQLDMNSNYIINVPSPNDPLHTANKAYVDSLLSGTTDAGSAQLRVDLASSADGSTGGSIVGVYDPSSVFTATDVTAILLEIVSDLAATGSGASGAATIGVEDALTFYDAADVEGALKELAPVGIINTKGVVDGAGTANAITGAFTPTLRFTDGMIVSVKAVGQITSTTPTFKPDTATARTIVRYNNEALLLSDIAGSDQTLLLQYDLGLLKWILLNPRQTKFRGCSVYHSADQAITTATGTILAFNTELYDDAAIHDNSTNNSRVTVPTGVTRVRIHGIAQFEANASGYRRARIYKDGGTVAGASLISLDAPGSDSPVALYVQTPVLTVTAGQYFEIWVYQTSGGNLNIESVAGGIESWFAMEIIE